MNLHNFYYGHMPKWTKQYSPIGGWYNYAHYFLHPHTIFAHWYLEIKWFIQRGNRGYSDCDVWGWYGHHATMMVGVLKQIRKSEWSHPIGLTMTSWDRKLAVMQDGFQALIDEESDFTSHKKLSREDNRKLVFSRRRRLNLGLKYFRKYYQNLWD